MPNTYSQLYVQLVFATKRREKIIHRNHKVEIEKYICGIINNQGCKPLAIFLMPDHIHILINYKPNKNISELVKEIKSNSSSFINSKKWLNCKFQWQEGYGAFSYSLNDLDRVINYINNQEEHHKINNFKTEYLILLKKHNIEYLNEYLFDWLEE